MECSRAWRHGVAGRRNEANPSWDPHTPGRGVLARISGWRLHHGDTKAAKESPSVGPRTSGKNRKAGKGRPRTKAPPPRGSAFTRWASCEGQRHDRLAEGAERAKRPLECRF